MNFSAVFAQNEPTYLHYFLIFLSVKIDKKFILYCTVLNIIQKYYLMGKIIQVDTIGYFTLTGTNHPWAFFQNSEWI